MIVRNLEGYRGVEVGGHNRNLRYADDTVLIAEDKEDLKRLFFLLRRKQKERVGNGKHKDRSNGRQSKQ